MELKEELSPNSSSNSTTLMAKQKRKAGRKKFQETRHPIYKGVRKRNGKWVSEFRQPNNNKSRIWLGTFLSAEIAARAYDVAVFALKGHDSGSLNFPESVHLLPQVRSNSIKDIQYAALTVADQNFVDPVRSFLGCSDTILDEEELFNMPALIDSMAEGLILTPPAMKKGFNWNDFPDDDDDPVDLILWSN